MKIEILRYLRQKYFKIYSLNIFAGQKDRLMPVADLASWPSQITEKYNTRF